MKNTSIEWTDHTLNFWWGCTKVSPACTHCYAETVAKVFGKRLFGSTPTWGAGQPRYERLTAARKEALAMNKRAQRANHQWDNEAAESISRGTPPASPKPRRPRVFVNSMSDWLDPEVPIEWLAHLLETIHLCPNLDFQLLTKRPENWMMRVAGAAGWMRGGNPTAPRDWIVNWYGDNAPPPNVWIGTTVDDQARADQRILRLLEIPAKVRFLRCEPLLSSVDLKLDFARVCDFATANPSPPAIHWIIAGGESGGQARPTHPDWFRSLRDQCAAANVPFFFKQWGEWISVDNIRYCTSEKARLDRPLTGHKFPDGTLMLRLGSDHTGRILDDQLQDGFPNAKMGWHDATEKTL